MGFEYLVGIKLTKTELRNTFTLRNGPPFKSRIYYNWWNDSLYFYPEFTIVLDSISVNKTKIRIESEIKVKAGLTFDTNHGIPYIVAYKRKVSHSTIEEYEIIKNIGDILGQRKMPSIQYVK